MREHTNEIRVYCDGCSYAVVEAQADYIDRAFDGCGWLHRVRDGRKEDLCPMCRPDSPFEAVQRQIWELCQSAKVVISKGCLCYGDECSGTCGRGKPLGWSLDPDAILRILDGGDA